MRRRADALTTAVINEQRLVTLTGRPRAVLPVAGRVIIEVECAADAEVEVGAS
jgi:hypothetical protein